MPLIGEIRAGEGLRPTAEASMLRPYWQTTDGETVRLYQGHVIDVLKRMPAGKVQCVVTSPPYWGLRDYGTGTWEGGDPDCDHSKAPEPKPYLGSDGNIGRNNTNWDNRHGDKRICSCGAQRTDRQLGSEARPDCLGWARGENCAEKDWENGCHVCRMVMVFRGVRRVLRDDGTLWLNYGDSYGGGKAGGGVFEQGRTDGRPGDGGKERWKEGHQYKIELSTNLKPGNLVGVPWRVAFALQADGWVLRQDIIWAKPSPMPESVRNRCTKAHEYLFLLTKSNRYYCDMEAIKETSVDRESLEGRRETGCSSGLIREEGGVKGFAATRGFGDIEPGKTYPNRNKRSVWSIASQGYPGAHFATFPPKLIEPCILAGTSERGACGKCGAPWRRVVEEKQLTRERPNDYVKYAETRQIKSGLNRDRGDGGRSNVGGNSCSNSVAGVQVRTIGWEPTCECGVGVASCIVMDPFIGSGTTAAVAVGEGRRCWGIDLSEKYLRENAVPRVTAVLFGRPALRGLVPTKAARPVMVGKAAKTLGEER